MYFNSNFHYNISMNSTGNLSNNENQSKFTVNYKEKHINIKVWFTYTQEDTHKILHRK